MRLFAKNRAYQSAGRPCWQQLMWHDSDQPTDAPTDNYLTNLSASLELHDSIAAYKTMLRADFSPVWTANTP